MNFMEKYKINNKNCSKTFNEGLWSDESVTGSTFNKYLSNIINSPIIKPLCHKHTHTHNIKVTGS